MQIQKLWFKSYSWNFFRPSAKVCCHQINSIHFLCAITSSKISIHRRGSFIYSPPWIGIHQQQLGAAGEESGCQQQMPRSTASPSPNRPGVHDPPRHRRTAGAERAEGGALLWGHGEKSGGVLLGPAGSANPRSVRRFESNTRVVCVVCCTVSLLLFTLSCSVQNTLHYGDRTAIKNPYSVSLRVKVLNDKKYLLKWLQELFGEYVNPIPRA